MNEYGLFQFKMMERLGGSLMGAITAVKAGSDQASRAPAQVAGAMAELLNRSVQLGIILSESIELRAGEEAEPVRVALTALSAEMMAEMYRHSGVVPGETDMRRIVPALQAVLTFSSNFPPSDAAAARLDWMDSVFDEYQVDIMFMQTFVPVIGEVGRYSFGRPERKMVQDVADRLTARAAAMQARLYPDASGAAANQAMLAILKALAGLYLECHRAEKARLESLDAAALEELAGAGGLLSLDGLWGLFEERVAMMEVLTTALSLKGGSDALAPVRPVNNIPAAALAPATPIPATIEATPEQPVEAEIVQPVNPMAFFKPGGKKPESRTGQNGDNSDRI